MRKHILDNDFWCLQRSRKPPFPQNRTLLCPFCATVWRTQGLMLSGYWLVLLPWIWQFPLPSGTPSVQKRRTRMPEGPAVSQIWQLYTVATIPMLLFLSKLCERCVPSSTLLKYEELHVWKTLSTHPENTCMRNGGSFKTFVVSQVKGRCSSTSNREERRTHSYCYIPYERIGYYDSHGSEG